MFEGFFSIGLGHTLESLNDIIECNRPLLPKDITTFGKMEWIINNVKLSSDKTKTLVFEQGNFVTAPLTA